MKSQRRLVERTYSWVELRKLFEIPADETLHSIEYSKGDSKLTVITLKEYDKRKGDVEKGY